MSTLYDVVIVGGGAVGASTAYHLLQENPRRKVLLLEKSSLYGSGASGAWGSLIRIFSIKPHVTRMAAETLSYFHSFEEKVGTGCGFVNTGSLYFFSKNSADKIHEQIDFLRSLPPGSFELVGAGEGRERFPDFQWADGDVAVYEAGAGFACPFTTTAAWVQQAGKMGLEQKLQTQVQKLRVENGVITELETDSGEMIRAKRFLFCTGPWTLELLKGIGISLPAVPLPIQVNRFHHSGTRDGLPFFLDFEQRTFARSFGNNVLFGGYLDDRETSVSSYRQPLSLKDANESKKRLSVRMKSLRTSTLAGGIRAVELYSLEPAPIVRFHESVKNMYVATAWSCCGFSMSPHFGKKIADDLNRSLD